MSGTDTNNIRALARILNEYGLTVLETGEGAGRVRLEKAARVSPAPAPEYPGSLTDAPPPAESGAAIDFNRLTEVKSPMVGVFYSAPAPDADAFVHIESKVKKGDVLCIIEAMKLMNEIVADKDGEIADICVKNGDIVEFGQVLFKIF